MFALHVHCRGLFLWKSLGHRKTSQEAPLFLTLRVPYPEERGNAGGPHPGRARLWPGSGAGHLHSALWPESATRLPHQDRAARLCDPSTFQRTANDCHALKQSEEAQRRTPRISRQDSGREESKRSLETHSGDKGSQRMFQLPRVQRSNECAPCLLAPLGEPGVAGGPDGDSLVPAASPEGGGGCYPFGRRLSKEHPGKCQVLSWGFRQKSLLMIMAFRGDATARLASERWRRRQVLHL